MPSPAECRPSPPVWRWRALLVLGVLAGLLGMHALGPTGGLMPGAHERPAAMATAVTATPSAHSGCDGACGGSHIHHADPTCASPALGGGPTLSGPPSTPVADCGHDLAAARSGTAPSPADGRAPPTLAELQLLRI
ncbi:DUF6153 family protein [Streptomyces sp. NBS 14/10]|uniref:DUF6153 family protein n=1 Tax=Streptomyces sp. NBS 14/10 TaxID=1945643 RepID=UPI00211B67D0|nr:DUF6153 family protein [Streptomyces sp. NBS 14/10]KAK1181075.1 DUF6153 family protein [Streptomyces sp. NBS 14/10]